MKPQITLPDGTPLEPGLTNLKPKVFGFKIMHKLTERILPGTTRNEIYSKAAAITKMNQIASAFNQMEAPLDIWSYELIPIFDFEKPKDFVYIVDNNDKIY